MFALSSVVAAAACGPVAGVVSVLCPVPDCGPCTFRVETPKKPSIADSNCCSKEFRAPAAGVPFMVGLSSEFLFWTPVGAICMSECEQAVCHLSQLSFGKFARFPSQQRPPRQQAERRNVADNHDVFLPGGRRRAPACAQVVPQNAG